MNCYPEYLEYLKENLASDNLPPLTQACPQRIVALQKEIPLRLGVTLPDHHAEFLRSANGFQYNGVFVYSTGETVHLPSLLTENLILRSHLPLLKDYLVLGQSSLWFYSYHSPSETFQALQIGALNEPVYIFADYDDCISSVLEETLELLEEEN